VLLNLSSGFKWNPLVRDDMASGTHLNSACCLSRRTQRHTALNCHRTRCADSSLQCLGNIIPFEIKSDNSNDGTFFGYGSTFGNVDSYGDIVAPGAFADSIAAVKSGTKAWPAMLLQHGDSTSDGKMPIGIWTNMEEDDRGLRLQGKLAIKNRRGAEAYALLKMQPRPALNGLSIGYRVRDSENHKSGPVKRTLKAIDLVEVSLVTFPADRFARVVSVKSWQETAPEMTMQDFAMMEFERMRSVMQRNGRG
jgi:uncharacterized protein